MKIFVCIFMIFSLISCSIIEREPLEYSTKQKILTGSMVAFQGLDILTTHNLTTEPGYEEGNPVLSGVFGKEATYKESLLFKGLIISPAYYFFIHKAETHESRDRALWIFNGFSVAPVINNVSKGGSISFKINW